MKPKPNDILGEGSNTQPESKEIMGSGEVIPMSRLRIDGFYVQFPGESFEQAVAEHKNEPFKTIEECFDFVSESGMEIGQTFNVTNINGQILALGILTHDGAIGVNPDDLRRR